MNSLKRQAAKAERYARLRDEMRVKLRIVLASKFTEVEREATELDNQLNRIADEIRDQTDAVHELESEHGERTQRGYGIDAELRQNRDRLNTIAIEIDRANARRHTNDERCAELLVRAELEANSAQHVSALSIEEELTANRQVLESAAADLAVAQNDLALGQQEAAAATAALTALEAEQEAYRATMMESVAAVSALHNQLAQSEERLAGIDREGQRLQAEIATSKSHVDAFGGQRGQLALEFETVSQRLGGLSDELLRVRQTLELKRREETGAKTHLDGLRAEYASALGKKGSLEAVIAEHGYSTESVRRLFQSGTFQGGLAPVGVLADFLEVEARYEGVVEDFLRDELNYIVVKSWDAADEGLRLLRSDVDGRATFLVHPEDSQAKFSFLVDEAGRPPAPDHSIIPLKNTIRVLDGFGKSLEVILPKLRDGYIVPDPTAARNFALSNPDAFFLSQTGECFHNVTVTGGKQRSEGPLSMKRELREVQRILETLEQQLRHEETRVLTLGHEIRDLSSLLDRLENDKREADKQAMTSGHLLQQLDTEMQRTSERLQTAQLELHRLSTERSELESA
jgi:chromosome segregation protein